MFLYTYILLHFILNLCYYIAVDHRRIVRRLIRNLKRNDFSLQLCILLAYYLFCVLILSGDIEVNPGPINQSNQILSVCHWNLNGIAAHNYIKLSLLEAYNAVYKYDVLCISETFLDSTSPLNDDQLKLNGYDVIRSDHVHVVTSKHVLK